MKSTFTSAGRDSTKPNDILRRLSSRSTFFIKRTLPAIPFGIIAFPVAVFVSWAMRENQPLIAILIFFLILGAFVIFFVLKHAVLNLADEVWDAGDELVVKNKGIEERIPLVDIINVMSYSCRLPRIILILRQPGPFGEEIIFTPAGTGFLFFSKPIARELTERIAAIREKEKSDKGNL